MEPDLRDRRPKRSSLFEKFCNALDAADLVGQILEAFPPAIVVLGIVVFVIVVIAWLME